MPRLKRIFVCLFVVFSLICGPLAHAAGICADTGSTIADEASKEKKQDDNKFANAGHHCCTNPVIERVGLSLTAPIQVKASVVIVTAQNHLASINVGPLLEPPSHA